MPSSSFMGRSWSFFYPFTEIFCYFSLRTADTPRLYRPPTLPCLCGYALNLFQNRTDLQSPRLRLKARVKVHRPLSLIQNPNKRIHLNVSSDPPIKKRQCKKHRPFFLITATHRRCLNLFYPPLRPLQQAPCQSNRRPKTDKSSLQTPDAWL